VLGLIVSLTITRPIRRLAGEMDRIAATDTPELDAATDRPIRRRGPAEVLQLTESFDHLLSRLARAQAELARKERLAAVGTMSAAVAHELRNPLSGIKMNARLLRDELADAPAGETLELILGEIDRMDLTLQELLDLAGSSSVDAGIEVDLAPVSAGDIATSAAHLLEGKFDHAEVTLETAIPPDLPAARADARRLRQVLVNLLLNALAATPAGGRVTVDAEARESTLRLRVCDTGPGLTAEQVRRVFEPFVSDTPGGAGLGLYVSRSIVEACGGTLEYEPSAEGGCFAVTLPRG
jgi:signal transduction histidine kinase